MVERQQGNKDYLTYEMIKLQTRNLFAKDLNKYLLDHIKPTNFNKF